MKNEIEIHPVLESFANDIIDGSETAFGSDSEYTYSDLLNAVIEDDYEDFEEMIGGPCEDLFYYIQDVIENDDELEDDENLGEAVLTVAQRRRRAQTMRKYRTKIANARKRAKRRKASPEKLKARARRKARNMLKARFTQGKDYGEMSAAEKMMVDKRLARVPKTMIDRLAQRQLPQVRNAEVERLTKLNQSYENVHQLIEDLTDINKLFESKFGVNS